MSGSGSKDLIAAAARAEFAEHGYAGARVARIANRAGLNKQLIFYYFGSKAGLYAAVVQEDRSDLSKIPADHPGEAHATKGLREEIGHLTDFLAGRRHLLRGMVSGLPGAESGRLVDDAVERIRRVISDGQGRGYFRDGCDPAVEANHAVALVVGHLVVRFSRGNGPDEATAGTDLASSVSDLIVRNLSW